MRMSPSRLNEALTHVESLEDRELLLKVWRQTFDQPPPRNISTGLMKRAIAHNMQEKALGGLRSVTRRYLLHVTKQG